MGYYVELTDMQAHVLMLIFVAAFGEWRILRRRFRRRRARQLAAVTGLPARQVFRELVDGRLAPTDWAIGHGLDPDTFGRFDLAAVDTVARRWSWIRHDEAAQQPPTDELARIGRLHAELARILAGPIAHDDPRVDVILVDLHQLGARVDGPAVNGTLWWQTNQRPDQPAEPRTQEEYDVWQGQAVARTRDTAGSGDGETTPT
jgi:hypothetical protein